MQQSFAWWCFGPHVASARELLEQAAALGYAGVDLVDASLWPLVHECGLAITAVGGHQSLVDGLNRRANHDRIERELLANLELAARWSIPNLICFSGNRGGLDDEAGAEQTAAGLQRVARAAEQAG